MSEQYREKSTEIDSVLPPVAKLLEDKPSKHRFTDLDGNLQVLEFRELANEDPYPIPRPVDREGYGAIEFSHQHWATGHGDWLNVQDAMARYLPNKATRLLDFGCATGRFLRHVMTFGEIEAHGCDFAPANVNWVKRHLPKEMQVILNTANPGLPYDDDYFDVVTAFSVFTHIDERETQWLAELKRITKPDGLLYITIQNEATWDAVLEHPSALAHMQNASISPGDLTVTKELFEKPMPTNRLVVRKSDAPIYNCSVWHSSQYIRDNWSQQFEILKFADTAHNRYQSVVIAKLP